MTHKTPQFEMQKMPRELDQRIQASFERRNLWSVLQNVLRPRSTVWPATVVASCAALYLVAGHNSIYAEAQIWAAIVDHESQRQVMSRQGIVHERSIVTEGKDKSLVVAIKNDLPPHVTAAVAKRSDTVEIWTHNITALVKAEKNIDQAPAFVAMNLENDDHLHLFESTVSTCDVSEISESCGTQELSEEGIAHRTLFDSVHDIRSNYDYQADPLTVKNLQGLPQMELVASDEASLVFRHDAGKDVRVEYYFDKETLDRQKEITSIAMGDQWYEMAVKEYVEYEILPATDFATIFDATEYSLKQKSVIPLSTSARKES